MSLAVAAESQLRGEGHIFTQSAKIPCLLPDMVKTLQVYKNAVLF